MTDPCLQNEKFLEIEKRLSILETHMETAHNAIESIEDNCERISTSVTKIETILESKLGDNGAFNNSIKSVAASQRGLAEKIEGNGKPGLITDVDRLKQTSKLNSRFFWVLFPLIAGILIKLLIF